VTFNEANTVRDFVRDLLRSVHVQFLPGADLPRTKSDVLLEGRPVREALILLNPEIEPTHGLPTRSSTSCG
jgi:type I restriction enzyme R subunit